MKWLPTRTRRATSRVRSRRDLAIFQAQQPSPVPSNAQISFRIANELRKQHLSFLLSAPFPWHASCKSIHSSGRSTHMPGFSVSLGDSHWERPGGSWHCCQAVHPTLTRMCLFALYSPGHINTKICFCPSLQPLHQWVLQCTLLCSNYPPFNIF